MHKKRIAKCEHFKILCVAQPPFAHKREMQLKPCLYDCRMAIESGTDGTVAPAKAAETDIPKKKAVVSLHDDRDLEGNIKDHALKVNASASLISSITFIERKKNFLKRIHLRCALGK